MAVARLAVVASEIQSEVNQNDAAIDFSQSTILGLSNPVVIPGLTNDWNVSYLQHIIMVDHCIDHLINFTFI